MKKLTKDQEKRFVRHLFSAFREMDDPSTKKKSNDFQKLIYSYIAEKYPSVDFPEQPQKIEDAHLSFEALDQRLEESDHSFLEVLEDSFRDINKSESVIGTTYANQMKEVFEKYEQLKEQFLVWDSYNNIHNY